MALTLQAADLHGPVRFDKVVLTDQYYCDGINAADIDRDGHMDIVAGPFWYAGPDFKQRHEIYPPKAFPPAKSPTDCMYVFIHDFNGDQWPDVLVLGRVHLHAAYWYENPRHQPGHWRRHFVNERVQGESPAFTDLDGDGYPEIVCIWQSQWGALRADPQAPEKPWRFFPIIPEGNWHHFYHGTGVGDVDGDGRLDLILNDGWWEPPAAGPWAGPWIAHRWKFSKGRGGAQMFAYDVDWDGDADVITSLDAHGWGLAWFEQVSQAGKRAFVQHTIMGDRSEERRYGVAFSQPHALALADLDGDGLQDIIVGKRRWAHGPTGDVEPNARPVLYWFQLERPAGAGPRYRPWLIDDASGVGVQIVARDVNRDGAPDILSASKLGSFVFLNRRSDRQSP